MMMTIAVYCVVVFDTIASTASLAASAGAGAAIIVGMSSNTTKIGSLF